jgi:hypothetical protein
VLLILILIREWAERFLVADPHLLELMGVAEEHLCGAFAGAIDRLACSQLLETDVAAAAVLAGTADTADTESLAGTAEGGTYTADTDTAGIAGTGGTDTDTAVRLSVSGPLDAVLFVAARRYALPGLATLTALRLLRGMGRGMGGAGTAQGQGQGQGQEQEEEHGNSISNNIGHGSTALVGGELLLLAEEALLFLISNQQPGE